MAHDSAGLGAGLQCFLPVRGYHLGTVAFGAVLVRRWMGPGRVLGFSAHAPNGYVLFVSTTKIWTAGFSPGFIYQEPPHFGVTPYVLRSVGQLPVVDWNPFRLPRALDGRAQLDHGFGVDTPRI